MNFAFSEEQDELRKSVRRFLDDKSPETEVRRLMETTEGYDPAVWTQMAEQLGLQSLTIPEQFGGSGYRGGGTAVTATTEFTWQGQPASAEFDLPPLGVVLLGGVRP